MFSMEWILAYPVSLNAMIRLLSSRVPAPSLTPSNSTRKSPKACMTMPAKHTRLRLVAEFGVGGFVMRDLMIDLALSCNVSFREARRVDEVEHSGLVAGQTQSQQFGH